MLTHAPRQCLAIDPHPVCLELLAHVGYAKDFSIASPPVLADGLYSNYLPRAVASPHPTDPRRPQAGIPVSSARGADMFSIGQGMEFRAQDLEYDLLFAAD